MLAIEIPKEKSRRDYSLGNIWRTLDGYVRHPRKVTCLECGFLTAGNNAQLTYADRAMLHAGGPAGSIEGVYCLRGLWVGFELNGLPDDFWDELKEDRRTCGGYLKYNPGWSPKEHRDLLLKRQERKDKLLFLIAGAVIALIVQWVAGLLKG